VVGAPSATNAFLSFQTPEVEEKHVLGGRSRLKDHHLSRTRVSADKGGDCRRNERDGFSHAFPPSSRSTEVAHDDKRSSMPDLTYISCLAWLINALARRERAAWYLGDSDKTIFSVQLDG
jgi:hypothetical protein